MKYVYSTHRGVPVIKEPEPFEVAFLPVIGDQFNEGVFVHPRYVSSLPSSDYRIVEVEGRRLGRTVEILLDEPIEYAGEEFGILNVKGTGAKATEEMQILPNQWYDRRESSFRSGTDTHGRHWGVLLSSVARTEVYMDRSVFGLIGVPYVPHVGATDLPIRLQNLILGDERGVNLAQLNRAMKTNIRIVDLTTTDYPLEALGLPFDSLEMGRIDGKYINHLISMVKKMGRCVNTWGSYAGNRMVDGAFIDAFNYRNLYRGFIPRHLSETIRRQVSWVLTDNIGIATFSNFEEFHDINQQYLLGLGEQLDDQQFVNEIRRFGEVEGDAAYVSTLFDPCRLVSKDVVEGFLERKGITREILREQFFRRR